MIDRVVQLLPNALNFEDVRLNKQDHKLMFIDIKLSIFPIFMLHNIQHKIIE